MSLLAEPLVGRTTELDSLDLVLAELGRNGSSAVTVVGEPGMGKTRMLYPVESGFTWAFAMGALGAALLVPASMSMPGRTFASRQA